ncbi:MAG: LPS assembly lipoprotein LptE [Thiotrichales bacterium]|nr:LPS assembly lipoprotein LptE [Thiotrichales bacterium]
MKRLIIMSPRLLLLPLLACAVAACGFHLRGSGPGELNVSSVYVDASGARKLGEEVSSQLSGLGVTMTSSPDAAEYVLKLANERQERKVLTVSAATGKVEEYELIYSANMSVLDASGKAVGKNQQISARRDLSYDEDAVLGKFEEERTIQDELRKQVAANVLRRLNAAVR